MATAAAPSQDAAVRSPAVAGRFYPGDAATCRGAAQSFLKGHPSNDTLVSERRWFGAVVPHAGWVCSAMIAGKSIDALARSAGPESPEVVVVFGAVHTPVEIDFAALDAHLAWSVPGGDTPLATDLSDRLTTGGGMGLFAVAEGLHRHEHAIEVELPLIQVAWPGSLLLPIEVPAIDDAVEIGRRVASGVEASGRRAVYLASSDLTHYGPSYGFAPAGVGPAGLEWAKANDRRLLDRVTDLAAEQIVPEARVHANACGAGAIAAMLAACRDRGATTARVLRHANSYETCGGAAAGQRPTDAVGYASVVVG